MLEETYTQTANGKISLWRVGAVIHWEIDGRRGAYDMQKRKTALDYEAQWARAAAWQRRRNRG